LGGGEPEDSAGSEGKLVGSTKPTKYLCKHAEGRAKFQGRGLGFSAITTIQIVLLEEERSRETEDEILQAIQSHREGRRGGIRARATRR
jgi:hypothetical protein